MYTARIVVLTIAPGAGGIAAYRARGFDAKSLQTEPLEATDQSAMRGKASSSFAAASNAR
jgi:hypothetical protein